MTKQLGTVWFSTTTVVLFGCSVSHCLQPWPAASSLPCLLPSPRACSNSRPSSQWCHTTISSSVIPLVSCLQSFPASGSYLMNQLFISGGHSIGVSALASVLPVNIQDWFPLGLTSWISLQSKGLYKESFPIPQFQKQHFFGVQPSLWFNSRTHSWLLEKP